MSVRAACRAAALVACCAGSGLAGGAEPQPLFQSDAVLAFKLEAPFSKLELQRGEQRDDHPGRLSLQSDGRETAIDLRVRVRGRSRATTEACAFPPLRLDFPTRALKGTPFEGQNRLKLVTYCRMPESHQKHIVLEYLAYRTLNLLSELSLRARLVRVTYVDGGRELATRYGILLEDEGRFARRMGLTPVRARELESGQYDAESLRVVELFQYLIGNTDWSVRRAPDGGKNCCHNVVPMARPDGRRVPVAYDFDLSGLVNAPYAAPPEQLPIRSVRQRLFRGACYDAATLGRTLAGFQARRDAIQALFEAHAAINAAAAREGWRYLEGFFDEMAQPDKVERQLRAPCR